MRLAELKKELTKYRLEVAAALRDVGVGLQHLDQAGDEVCRGVSPAEEVWDAAACFEEGADRLREVAEAGFKLGNALRQEAGRGRLSRCRVVADGRKKQTVVSDQWSVVGNKFARRNANTERPTSNVQR